MSICFHLDFGTRAFFVFKTFHLEIQTLVFQQHTFIDLFHHYLEWYRKFIANKPNYVLFDKFSPQVHHWSLVWAVAKCGWRKKTWPSPGD